VTTAYSERPYRRGVGALIVGPDGQVLVARRVAMPFEVWQLPQGGIKKNEPPAAAVLREVEEEIGTSRVEIAAEAPGWLRYDLPPELADLAWRGRWRGQEQKWFVLRFTGSDGDIDVARSNRPEFDAWRWEALSVLPHLAAPFKRQLYADLVETFAHVVDALASRTRD
jgi:putative (di)nucleoside polyphosphate hydrolase